MVVQPAVPGPVALALVPGEVVVDAVERPDPGIDGAADTDRAARFVDDDPVVTGRRGRLVSGLEVADQGCGCPLAARADEGDELGDELGGIAEGFHRMSSGYAGGG